MISEKMITAQDMVSVTCYGKTKRMKRCKAIKTYFEGMCQCDGAEKERYERIFLQLMQGAKVASDSEY